MSLCGCAGDKLQAPLQVDLSSLQICEQLLQRPPLPAVRPTDDARAAFMKDEAALLNAGERIDAGRGCVADVRQSYGGKARP